MNTNKIAEETTKAIALALCIDLTPEGEAEIDAIIQAAIEKATEEGQEIGSTLMAEAVVKAFTGGGRFGFTDENDPRYKLNQILDSRAAHASEDTKSEKSDLLYDALEDAIEKHKHGMTTYQIMGTLTSLLLRFWERYTK